MDLRTAFKKVTPTHGLIVSLLLLLILVPMNVYWNMDRANKFQAWGSQYREAQSFTEYHIWTAAALVNTTNFQTNSTVQNWYRQELESAQQTLYEITQTDTANRNNLTTMENILYNLGTNLPYVTGLTNVQRITLSKILHSIGDDTLSAYTKYGDFTNMNSWTLFWYSGPMPPDENLLNQAYTLTTTLPGLPALTV
jgi:hypothetical protein